MASPTSPSSFPNQQQSIPSGRRRTGSEAMDSTNSTTTKPPSADQSAKNVDLRMDEEEFQVRKRLPPRFPVRKNDVYVTRRTNFKAQLSRCEKLLDSGFDTIFIHGLGAAVNRAINLALQLKRRGLGSLDVAVNTSTVEVTDDLESLLDDVESQSRVRNCSAIHIKVFRTDFPVTDY